MYGISFNSLKPRSRHIADVDAHVRGKMHGTLERTFGSRRRRPARTAAAAGRSGVRTPPFHVWRAFQRASPAYRVTNVENYMLGELYPEVPLDLARRFHPPGFSIRKRT